MTTQVAPHGESGNTRTSFLSTDVQGLAEIVEFNRVAGFRLLQLSAPQIGTMGKALIVAVFQKEEG